MSIPYIEIILFLCSTILSGLLFYVKTMSTELKDVKQELHEHKIDDAKEYITHIEMRELKDDIRGMVGSINNKLQGIEAYLRDNKN
jgi:hypothetical protein